MTYDNPHEARTQALIAAGREVLCRSLEIDPSQLQKTCAGCGPVGKLWVSVAMLGVPDNFDGYILLFHCVDCDPREIRRKMCHHPNRAGRQSEEWKFVQGIA